MRADALFIQQTPEERVVGAGVQTLPFAYDTQLASQTISLSQPIDIDFGSIISDRPYIMVNHICWKALKTSHILLKKNPQCIFSFELFLT